MGYTILLSLRLAWMAWWTLILLGPLNRAMDLLLAWQSLLMEVKP